MLSITCLLYTSDYHVDAPVKDFETGSFNESEKVRVKRFNDTYHNEAIVAKAGIVDKSWADRLMSFLSKFIVIGGKLAEKRVDRHNCI